MVIINWYTPRVAARGVLSLQNRYILLYIRIIIYTRKNDRLGW